MTCIAIMQPYFMPYAGYFRLFAAADLIVMYDDVQFPKEGWVHRNRLPNQQGELDWLTLPLKKAHLSAKIHEREFAENAHERWCERQLKFPVLASNYQPDHPIKQAISTLVGTPVEFILDGLKTTCNLLDLPFNVVRSSTENVAPDQKGQDRVLSIVKHYGGKKYINPPGGRQLYNAKKFTDQGIELEFFSDYDGNMNSILWRLLTDNVDNVRQEIMHNMQEAA